MAATTVDALPRSRLAPAGRAAIAAALSLASALMLLVSAAAFAELRFLDWGSFLPALGAAALWLAGGGLLLGAALWLSPWRLPFMQPARGEPGA